MAQDLEIIEELEKAIGKKLSDLPLELRKGVFNIIIKI